MIRLESATLSRPKLKTSPICDCKQLAKSTESNQLFHNLVKESLMRKKQTQDQPAHQLTPGTQGPTAATQTMRTQYIQDQQSHLRRPPFEPNSSQGQYRPTMPATQRGVTTISSTKQQCPSLLSCSTTKVTHSDMVPAYCLTKKSKPSAHLYQQPLLVSAYSRMTVLSEQVYTSCVMTHILSYLHSQDQIKYQQLNRFCYKVQQRSFPATLPLHAPKRRLHLLNQNYILLFNFDTLQKSKHLVKNISTPLWNHQSIEVRGRIYSTGGALANSKTYLKRCQVLNESKMVMEDIAEMKYERDAHGICSWVQRYIICVGSWHGTGARTCEIYDIQTNKWELLPPLNDGTCAPGLCVLGNNLYKLGGTSDIGKVEMLDLVKRDRWVTINTQNKYGRKHTINRCLLHPILPRVMPDSRDEDLGSFIVLGCHFGRGEKPFQYDLRLNKYKEFQDKEMHIDMYRSNDAVHQRKAKWIGIRPFVKVGEGAEQVKCYQYLLEDCSQSDVQLQLSQKEYHHQMNEAQEKNEQHEGPKRATMKKKFSPVRPPQTSGFLNRLQSMFSNKTRKQTPPKQVFKKGTLIEIPFKTGVWQASPADEFP